MRMTAKVREALRRAANLEHRTMASLLEKIIADYLEKQEHPFSKTVSQERRKNPRINTVLPSVTHYKTEAGSLVSFPCVVLNLSLGGALIAYPRGSEIEDASIREMPNFSLCLELPRMKEQACFQCASPRAFDIDNGLKIGAKFIDSQVDSFGRLGAYLG